MVCMSDHVLPSSTKDDYLEKINLYDHRASEYPAKLVLRNLFQNGIRSGWAVLEMYVAA